MGYLPCWGPGEPRLSTYFRSLSILSLAQFPFLVIIRDAGTPDRSGPPSSWRLAPCTCCTRPFDESPKSASAAWEMSACPPRIAASTISMVGSQSSFGSLFHGAGQSHPGRPKAPKDDELVAKLVSQQNYLHWNSDSNSLKAGSITPLPMVELLELVEKVTQLLCSSLVVTRFMALHPLHKLDPHASNMTVPWRLEISVRGPHAMELHRISTRLCWRQSPTHSFCHTWAALISRMVLRNPHNLCYVTAATYSLRWGAQMLAHFQPTMLRHYAQTFDMLLAASERRALNLALEPKARWLFQIWGWDTSSSQAAWCGRVSALLA